MITISELTSPAIASMERFGGVYELTYVARVYRGDANTYDPGAVPFAWDVQPSRELRNWVMARPHAWKYVDADEDDQCHIEILLGNRDSVLFKLTWM